MGKIRFVKQQQPPPKFRGYFTEEELTQLLLAAGRSWGAIADDVEQVFMEAGKVVVPRYKQRACCIECTVDADRLWTFGLEDTLRHESRKGLDADLAAMAAAHKLYDKFKQLRWRDMCRIAEQAIYGGYGSQSTKDWLQHWADQKPGHTFTLEDVHIPESRRKVVRREDGLKSNDPILGYRNYPNFWPSKAAIKAAGGVLAF